MEGESETRAAEMLPGRVVNMLVSRILQETHSWPTADGRKTFHKAIPMELANFARRLVSELGVEADAALDKRIRHKFTDLAWKKGLREKRERESKAGKKRKIAPTERPVTKKRAVQTEVGDDFKEASGTSDSSSEESGSESDGESGSSSDSGSSSSSNESGSEAGSGATGPKGAVAKHLVRKAKTPEQVQVQSITVVM